MIPAITQLADSPPSELVKTVSQATEGVTLASDFRVGALTKRENPWGAFVPGSWVTKRTTTSTYVNGALLSNTTNAKLTLESVEDNRITIRHETSVDLEGHVYMAEPQLFYYDFYQQPLTDDVEIEQLAPQYLTILRRQMLCQVCRYTQLTSDYKKTTTVWYTSNTMPYVLRTEELKTTIPTATNFQEQVISHKISAVSDTSGVRLFKNLLNEYKTQTIKKTAGSTTVITTTCSPNIPGGVLKEVAVETDNAGNIISRTETSVLNYYVACLGTPVTSQRLMYNSSREIQVEWELTIQGDGGFPK